MKKINRPMRVSRKPGKSLLWHWLRRDAHTSNGLEVGIDVGCGVMSNRELLHTKKYVGIDLDGDRLAKGKAKYREAMTIQARIQDVSEVSGDFVLCVQMIGINVAFDNEDVLFAVRKLVEMCNPDAYLAFNVGAEPASMKHLETQIDEILSPYFETISKKRYGAFHACALPSKVSLAVAYAMVYIPPLRTLGGHAYRRCYYFCASRNGKWLSEK